MAVEQTNLFNFEGESVKDVSQKKDDTRRKTGSANRNLVWKFADEEEPGTVKKSTRGRIKLSEGALTADLIEVPEDEILFQKKYYSIGLVADMFKVNISLIRFWEKEFDILKPKKNAKGDRHFRPEDIKNLKMIHHLLREKKYTIEGANDFLRNNKKADENFAVIEQLKKTQLFLNELKLSL